MLIKTYIVQNIQWNNLQHPVMPNKVQAQETTKKYIKKKRMKQIHQRLCGLCLAAIIAASACAQRVSFKTNALYWGTLSPNAGVEFRLSRHFTLNFEGAVNPFSIGDYKLHAAAFTPEARYWFSGRPQAGHFVGLMGFGGIYSMAWNHTNHVGDALGGGLTYGYSFVLSRRWSLETTIGLGMLHVREKKYAEGAEEPKEINNTKTIPAPLKAGVTFTYILK